MNSSDLYYLHKLKNELRECDDKEKIKELAERIIIMAENSLEHCLMEIRDIKNLEKKINEDFVFMKKSDLA